MLTKRNVQALIQKRLKACKHPSSRPSNMPPGARAGAFVFAKRQTRPTQAPCSARQSRLGFSAAMKNELVLISECCFREVSQLKI